MKMEELLASMIRTEIGPEFVSLADNAPALIALVADGLKYRSDLIDELCNFGAIPEHMLVHVRPTYLRMPGPKLAVMLQAFEENKQHAADA